MVQELRKIILTNEEVIFALVNPIAGLSVTFCLMEKLSGAINQKTEK